MKFLIDMNLSPLWVEFLSGRGFHTIHWSSVGEPTAPDTLIMEFASAGGFIVFTHDLDFGMLLAAHKASAPSSPTPFSRCLTFIYRRGGHTRHRCRSAAPRIRCARDSRPCWPAHSASADIAVPLLHLRPVVRQALVKHRPGLRSVVPRSEVVALLERRP